MLLYIIIGVAAFCVGAVIFWFASKSHQQKVYDGKIGSAEEKARSIIDEAVVTAENKKREALLEVKEESLRVKNDLEKETKERRAELQRYERRVLNKEENVEKKSEALEKKEASLASKEDTLNRKQKEVEELYQKEIQELERISGYTSEQAKEYLLKTVEDDVKHDTAKMIKEMEVRAREEAGEKVEEYIVAAV